MATSIIPPMQDEPNQDQLYQAYGCHRAKPQHRKAHNLVECTDDWIQAQMIRDPQHPSWWQELKVLYRGLVGKLSDTQALQLTQWQAMAFHLPTAQEEVSGWWEAPHNICGLGHWDFLPHIDFPSTRDAWVTRQEETLAMA